MDGGTEEDVKKVIEGTVESSVGYLESQGIPADGFETIESTKDTQTNAALSSTRKHQKLNHRAQ